MTCRRFKGHHTYPYMKPCKWVLLSFRGCFKITVIAIVIMIAFSVIVIDCTEFINCFPYTVSSFVLGRSAA